MTSQKNMRQPEHLPRVNLTADVLSRIPESRLHSPVSDCIDYALNFVLLRCNDEVQGKQLRYVSAVSKYFDVANRTSKRLDASFLAGLLRLAEDNSKNSKAAEGLQVLDAYLTARRVPGFRLRDLRQFARFVLIECWERGLVLLPSTFTPRTQLQLAGTRCELMTWLDGFGREDAPATNRKSDAHRIYHYGSRLLLATTWHAPEDVQLEDLAQLYSSYLRYRRGHHANPVGGPFYPWSALPTALWRTYQGRLPYNADDLTRFTTWLTAGHLQTESEFQNFRYANSEQLEEARAQRRREKQRVQRSSRFVPPDRSAQLRAGAGHMGLSDKEFFEMVAKCPAPRPVGADWRKGCPQYPLREHVDVAPLASVWLRLFGAYRTYRKSIKGCRTEDNTVSTLNALADYLFWYLPFWFERHPNTKLVYPASPKLLGRFAFVTRYEEVNDDEAPSTVTQLIRHRRRGNSLGDAVRELGRFFRFIALEYGEDEDVAGVAFRAPVDKDLDVPRGSRHSKSNKGVIPKRMFGYLLFFAYAVEKFGMHLFSCVVKGQFDSARLRAVDGFVPSEYGLELDIHHRGEPLRVNWVPNLFAWHEREFTDAAGGSQKVVVPHLSACRLCMLCLENGLRFQSGQWLDIRTWDCRNDLALNQSSEVFELFVNTDKVMVNPWETLLFPRTREMLLREQEFQKGFADRDAHAPVQYEDGDSPFGLIKPLFRASSSGKPISDKAYYKAWRMLLQGFERFYAQHTGESIRLFELRGVFDDSGQPLLGHEDDGEPYCVLRLFSAFTPHSCRTTFITHREGVMPLEFIAELVGHGSKVTTAHYSRPEKEDIQRRSIALHRAVSSDFQLFDASDAGAHIRADKPDSALVRGFTVNREAAVKEFCFVGGVSLWSTDALTRDDRNGMELLRSGPMSRIVFRETHVCPCGEECPDDIVKQIGDRFRCGLCPLAMKCIDHLTAVSAKKNKLKERIRHKLTILSAMREAKEPPAVLNELWASMELDVLELLGWTFSEEALSHELAKASSKTEEPMFLSERPDIIRKHLEKVTRHESEASFLLRRLAESNAYPSMASEQVHARATALKRKVLAGKAPELLAVGDDPNPISVVASSLRMLMKAQSLSLDDAGRLLADAEPPEAVEPLLLA